MGTAAIEQALSILAKAPVRVVRRSRTGGVTLTGATWTLSRMCGYHSRHDRAPEVYFTKATLEAMLRAAAMRVAA